MNSNRIFSSAIFIMSLAVAAGAHAQATAASAPTAMASMPQDCAKAMAKHSHATEKGMPVKASKSGACAPDASAPTKKDKTKHDHPRDAK